MSEATVPPLRRVVRHSGVEHGYLLEGSPVLTLGFDEYRLNAGDAVSFDSTTPHGYRNDGVALPFGERSIILNTACVSVCAVRLHTR